jgi:ABC-type transporter Mla subunit MlaD
VIEEPPKTEGTPRWVKVFAIVALVVVVLLVVVLLTGRGGGHGPGRHSGPPPGVTHQPP